MENGNAVSDKNINKDINWSRFGLGTETAQRVRANTSGFVDLSTDYDYGGGGHQASGANELFAEEQGDVPWWKSNFFISQPVLFGTWDGVFTSCLINIFGVIVFLRSGWIVSQAGVCSAIVIVLFTGEGFEGWLSGNLKENMWSHYVDGYSWFTVFGVFFPTITGILSGINMSGDLKAPSTNIPNGTLAAIGTGTFLYLIFVIFLGATCTREVLKNDFMIAAKVSIIRVLLLAGLYVSSMSSCLGAMYGTPRVLQSISLESVIPGIGILGKGRGPNKVPLYAMAVVAAVTFTFIFIGEINTLAPIVTMPFLLTYAAIDYAYFALAQTFDSQHQREQRFHRPRVQQQTSSDNSDLDRLFPERTRHKTLIGESNAPTSSDESTETSPISPKINIHSKQKNWYSNLCNRWLSLLGAGFKILIMLLVNWYYAITCASVVFLVWLYIGTANPAVKPGLATEFNFFRWLRNNFLRLLGRHVIDYEQIVVSPVDPSMDVTPSQLNEDNQDFANRRRYHQSATIHGHMVNIED